MVFHPFITFNNKTNSLDINDVANLSSKQKIIGVI